jgi:Mn2+/Fe2+ NRAMP family transporter
VTKRGHAEAIFHSFGAFWGWFSLRICIPAAFMINPPVDKVFHGSFIPHLLPRGFTNALFFLLMSNIGITIAP